MAEQYVLAAFKVDHSKAIKYRRFRTLNGITNAVADALLAEADYISIRRIRVAEG